MSAPAVTVDATDDLETAYRAFRRAGVRRLPVVDRHRLVGLLAVDDLFLDVSQHLSDLLGPLSFSALREGSAGPGPAAHPPISSGARHDRQWNTVGEVMTHAVVAVGRDATFREVLDTLQ
ncbi:CBS domain-containing protein [Kitasatospora sp. NBC_00374]|uniref:CBS domain-containing protein n=1 Tax=Kitasatospora sp. NBC_00374 TaxID=2975964 RepID=UPI0030E09D95